LAARVTNELASQFIGENLKAREQQATGTNEFLQSQLQGTRKQLEVQEAKLRDLRMSHIGETTEQQNADLQILGQLRSQLQLEGEALARAEQQKSYLQSTMTQTEPVVELDEPGRWRGGDSRQSPVNSAMPSKLASMRSRLTALQGRYTDEYPEIRKLRQEIADEEAKESTAKPIARNNVVALHQLRASEPTPAPPVPKAKRPMVPPP
jgi:uncharacterized protein involved in exopolysaccharide biosynthesis